MVKNCIFKILIAFVVICPKNYASGVKKEDVIRYICTEEKWQEMCFNSIQGPMGWKEKGDFCKEITQCSLVVAFKTIPLLMACGYGQDLTDFLWLTAHTVNMCNKISRGSRVIAQDCWTKLKDSINRGAHTIHMLLGAFQHIHSLDVRVSRSLFFDTLSPIHSFLHEQGTKNGLAEVNITIFTQRIKNLAISLAENLNSHCLPENKVFDLQKLLIEYRYPSIANVHYSFFTNRLNSHTKFIYLHLRTRLGFFQSAGKVLFNPNQSYDDIIF